MSFIFINFFYKPLREASCGMDLLLVLLTCSGQKALFIHCFLRPDFMIETCIYVPYKKRTPI